MGARALKAWWRERATRLLEAKLDWSLRREAQAGAQVYAQEVWDRRMKTISRVRLINGREIQLAERLRTALTEALAENAIAAALGAKAPLEQVWSWQELGARLRQEAARGGPLKGAAARSGSLLEGSDWRSEAKALLLEEAGYYFELFREDAALCLEMTETRMRALAAARELIAESRVRVGAPSLGALSRKDRVAGEALPVVMAEWAVRRAHQLPDPLEGVSGWEDLARLLMGQAGEMGPLRSAAPLARPLMLGYASGGEWNSIAEGFYLDKAGYGWESFKQDAALCERIVSQQRSDALAARPIPGRGARVKS